MAIRRCAVRRSSRMRPARVQIQWLGFLGSMGAEFIDYVLTDRIATPPDAQVNFTERFLYLEIAIARATPDARSRRGPSHARRKRTSAGRFRLLLLQQRVQDSSRAYSTSGCGCSHAIPESVLWLTTGNPAVRANLRLEAARRGIDRVATRVRPDRSASRTPRAARAGGPVPRHDALQRRHDRERRAVDGCCPC